LKVNASNCFLAMD